MFEESTSSIWRFMSSLFTPTVLFVLLNVMIGTIAFSSKFPYKKQHQKEQQNEPKVSRSTSILHHLKSINLYRSQERQNSSLNHQTNQESIFEETHEQIHQTKQTHLNSEQKDSNLGGFKKSSINFYRSQEQPQNMSQKTNQETIFEETHEQIHQTKQTHLDSEQKDSNLGGFKKSSINFYRSQEQAQNLSQKTNQETIFEETHEQIHQQTQTHFESEQKDSNLDGFYQTKEERDEIRSMDEVYGDFTGSHFSRTKSDTEPASGELPAKLPAKMRKSATMKSSFGHFEEEDIVEKLRPATVRVKGSAKVTDGDQEVDSKADDFINRFKQQLKLQRLDSIVRYKEMIGRGT